MSLTIDRDIQSLDVGTRITRLGGLRTYSPNSQALYVAEDIPQGKQHHLETGNEDGPGAFQKYLRVASLDVYGPDVLFCGWGRIEGYQGSSSNLGFKVHLCHQDNGNNYLAAWKRSGYINIIKENREAIDETDQDWGETLAYQYVEPPEIGKVFQFLFRKTWDGFLVAQFDQHRITAEDDAPLTSGAVGFRLDRTHSSFGSLVVR